MPVTPFHFGPGALLHAAAPRHVSFLAFCAANVLIDIESGYNLLRGADRVHAFFHTYVGATLVIVAVVALHAGLSGLARRRRVPDLFGWRSLGRGAVATGAVLGAYSHVLLDSVMHADARPLAPFSGHNPLLGWLSWDSLHGVCVALGVAGVAVLLLRRALAARG